MNVKDVIIYLLLLIENTIVEFVVLLFVIYVLLIELMLLVMIHLKEHVIFVYNKEKLLKK